MTFGEQLPGLNVHINEGRVNGTFELPPADMQHIRYQGRVVLVLVADAMAISIKDTKDGDTKASWTFKGVDAAIVRDQGMVDHLANVLYLDGLEGLDKPSIGTIPVRLPAPAPGMIGVYSDEGQFLGFEKEEAPEGVDAETGEIETSEEPAGAELEDEELDSMPSLSTEDKPGNSVDRDDDVYRPPATTRPIQNRDPLLERFLNNERVGSGL